MAVTISTIKDNPEEKIQDFAPAMAQKWPGNFMKIAVSEMKKQRGLAIPLIAMNLVWFLKLAITTAFLGRLGELQLAGGALGFTFANVTGFSVLNGLSNAMEPICGQAYGAKNFRLLRKSLVMTTFLLLITTLPVCFLWINVDKILTFFGQERDIALTARRYLVYLVPDLVITSFLCPLKAYLSSQNRTVPVMLSSAVAVALHVPINILLMKAKGLEGVAMAVWISDLIVVVLLTVYILRLEIKNGGRWEGGGWFEQGSDDWIRLLKLCGPCCLTTCLEWWCYELLVLLAGWLPNARQAVSVLAIVLNFDYLIYSVMLSLATSASIRVSNELGANQPGLAYQSACVSIAVSSITGCLGAAVMVASRGIWGPLFSNNKAIVSSVKKMIMLMALIEVVNFPLAVSGGIARGTARPWMGMYANLGGFYLLALPLSWALAFKFHLGLGGLLAGFFVGMVGCLIILLVFVARIDWVEEAGNAQLRASHLEDDQEPVSKDGKQSLQTPIDAVI
ncbi:hypothetical protein DCAR_0100821 [Daucus carota subsp. sativus]|uniref:Protein DETOXIFICATION n=1 Tax=Daucus carota subsp. sativus TaxID=79200 RepID=A0AAF0W4W1_DAUCS|nr:PREDICTED: protein DETOXIFICATION 56 [Daucus carota subsp. sativus]WOG81670.1 hypothetical protein DCAR_0100821 [Daucus carota subsp. sativus]